MIFRIVSGLFICGAAALGALSYVQHGNIEKLEAELDAKNGRLASLEASVKSLVDERDILNAALSARDAELDSARQRNADLVWKIQAAESDDAKKWNNEPLPAEYLDALRVYANGDGNDGANGEAQPAGGTARATGSPQTAGQKQ